MLQRSQPDDNGVNGQHLAAQQNSQPASLKEDQKEELENKDSYINSTCRKGE